MSLKILHIQSVDWGGAAKAALRLHKGLVEDGVDSKVLLKWKAGKYDSRVQTYQPQPEVYTFGQKLNNKWHNIVRRISPPQPEPDYLANAPKGYHQFSVPENKYHLSDNPLVQEADLIHLHWVSDFINYEEFFSGIDKPVVWTLHDMNPFTGGCHYALHCSNYENDCHACFQLQGTINPGISATFLKRKEDALCNFKDLHIVTPSDWLGRCSKESKLFSGFEHYVIHNAFDDKIFRPINPSFARDVFNLPRDRKLILFVAGDIECRPKGYHFILELIQKGLIPEDYFFCVVGQKSVQLINTPQIAETGNINDERLMALLYAAADVFVTPSLADNLPNTVAESLLCGTPVIGFPVGGIKDMVKDGENGILSKDTTAEGLAEALKNFFANYQKFDPETIAAEARKKYALASVIPQYVSLYRNVLKI